MDRTMYGKIDPGARNPYRVALKREKGISPGCKCRNCSSFYSEYLTKIKTLLYTQSLTNRSINQIKSSKQQKECSTKNDICIQ